MNSTSTIKMTCQDVANALNLFEKLEYGKGKAAAAVVVRSATAMYLNNQLATSRKARQPKVKQFTDKEIAYIRDGNKLSAVKLVRDRLYISLLEAKRYVEEKGAHYFPVNHPSYRPK